MIRDGSMPAGFGGDGYIGGPVKCPTCEAFSYETDRYCACCGTALHRMCRKCGASVVQPVAYFCTQCGVRLEEKEE